MSDANALAIDCQNLEFSWNQDTELVLSGVDLQLERGSRCLLIGANGGGWTSTYSCHSEARNLSHGGRSGSVIH